VTAEHGPDMRTAWPGDYDDEIACICGNGHTVTGCERSRLTAWEQAEAQADLAREYERAHRLARRREDRFWTPFAVLIIAGGWLLAGLIEGGAL
jgi:hypothetical protein